MQTRCRMKTVQTKGMQAIMEVKGRNKNSAEKINDFLLQGGQVVFPEKKSSKQGLKELIRVGW